MNSYLLDTNCFYNVAFNKNKQDKLLSLRPNIATSPLTILEIARISNKRDDFKKRKLAMEALDYINPLICPETPDEIVCRAFGIQKSKNVLFNELQATKRALILANSFEEAVNGVKDSQNKVTIKLNPKELHDWKKSLSTYFTHSIVSGNAETFKMYLNILLDRNPTENERKLKKEAKIISTMSKTHENAVLFTLLGLSIRAGLHSEEQFDLSSRDGSLIDLAIDTKSHYNGLLNSYINIYLAFQTHFSSGQIPEQNAIFDLEFFFHLDAHNEKYIFVTSEDFWVDLAKEFLPDRVIHFNKLID